MTNFRPLLVAQLVTGLVMVLVTATVISIQIRDRSSFAGSELYQDVVDRWGAPIVQAVPSVRAVESGSVFKTLESLPLEYQDVHVSAGMSYRKRGLVYFSGFEFTFQGRYQVTNNEAHDIDIAFVFPINLERNKVLLSDLTFTIGGSPLRSVFVDAVSSRSPTCSTRTCRCATSASRSRSREVTTTTMPLE
jgi:hypothetical protein